MDMALPGLGLADKLTARQMSAVAPGLIGWRCGYSAAGVVARLRRIQLFTVWRGTP
jgi:hypothetical protein